MVRETRFGSWIELHSPERYLVHRIASQKSLSIPDYYWFFGLCYAMDRIIRDETLIEKDIWRFLSIVFDLERTNQLNLLPDKDLVDLCPRIEPYQVTKSLTILHSS
ncbi:MAG UNVERIFIED_CONTAM: hypothetical protein LVR29_16850 [Microcystis novacekii LVE1205-3]|jgi:hypothetical protein